MTVHIGERWDQPVLAVWTDSGALGICQGIGVLDLSELEYTDGDWTRVPLVFSVAGPFEGKATAASVSVFPQSFDVGVMPNAPTDIGWGIDNAFVTNITDDGAEVTATLVLKTVSAEMLRVGWSVVFLG